MTLRQAIVLGDGGELHVTLQAGDTLDPSSLTVSTDPASLLLNNSVDGLGAYLTTKDSTSFKFAGAGSVSSPLTLTPIISPAAGNQLDVLPSGLFAGGLLDAPVTEFIDKPSGTDITPAYNKKYAANNIYLVGVNQGDYTLDVSNLTISALGLSPGYKIRLTAWSRGNSTVTLKGTSWTPSGSNTTGQVIQLSSRFTCWEITITAGTAPHVIQAWPVVPGSVQVSSKSDNAIQLLDSSSTTPGLYAPPSTTLKRGTGGGNFSFGYPDSKGARNACGRMGTGVYWKTTTTLSNAGAGNTAVMPKLWISKIPCMEDGTLVPYQFIVDYVESVNGAVPTAAVWLICTGTPTHLMDITTGTLTKLQMASSAVTSGLSGVYPVAPNGEYAQEPEWRREYFYTA